MNRTITGGCTRYLATSITSCSDSFFAAFKFSNPSFSVWKHVTTTHYWTDVTYCLNDVKEIKITKIQDNIWRRVYLCHATLKVDTMSSPESGRCVCKLWNEVHCVYCTVCFTTVKKIAHTRLPSVGFWSWSRFLAISLQVMWVINPAVGCHYFPPGLQLPLQPLRGLLPIHLLGEQGHNTCEQFS